VQVGVIYPQTELPTDPHTVRTCVRTVEQLGYRHVELYDHVLGADPAVHTGWKGPFDVDTTFHEPLVFYGFLAAITRLELVTGIVVAPQRQTALLAKQAAEVDILSEGRLRLGISVGWNPVEYEALSQDFSTRGRREEEQIGLLRRLWTERSVTHEGTFDRIVGAGLAPLPTQRPIPIWLGGQSPAAYRRIGRLADGWLARVEPGPDLDEALAVIAAAGTEAGRDRQRSGSTPASAKAPEKPATCSKTLNSGATPVQPTSLWTPWELAYPDSTPTSTRWQKQPRHCNSPVLPKPVVGTARSSVRRATTR
jgi:probable F420-dependent oxidoreductase